MPTNGSVAPVCPIVRSQIIPEQPRQMIPTIRRATDAPSTTAAVNQIAEVLETVFHNDDQPEWKEITRNTQRVRIHNPEDFNQWVEVERITRVVFKNKITSAILEWKYRY